MLSIIIPFLHEHPQLLFTLQSLICELRDTDVRHEFVLIDTAQIPQSDHLELDSPKYIQKKAIPNVKLLHCDKESHWNAKNVGVEAADGDVLLFLDAHVVPSRGSIEKMYYHFRNYAPPNSTLHLPIVYMLEDQSNALVYELKLDLPQGIVDYRFCKYQQQVEVPCMSTCGMMMAKDTLVNKYEMWPDQLGQYSGGEHFINFVGALLGIRKFISPYGYLYHYAAPRAYTLNYYDVYRNRAIATYLFGDIYLFSTYVNNLNNRLRGKISPRLVKKILHEIPNIPELIQRKAVIDANKIIDLKDWLQEAV
jgi:glycosyltransferase involved in cell wall biosynthesis